MSAQGNRRGGRQARELLETANGTDRYLRAVPDAFRPVAYLENESADFGSEVPDGVRRLGQVRYGEG